MSRMAAPAVLSRATTYRSRWKVVRSGKRWVNGSVSRKANRNCTPAVATRVSCSSSPTLRSSTSSGLSPRSCADPCTSVRFLPTGLRYRSSPPLTPPGALMSEDADTIRREFGEAVNMTAGELEKWLGTDEAPGGGQERAGVGAATVQGA